LAPLDGPDDAWTAPKQSEACTVPPNHGIGSNDGELGAIRITVTLRLMLQLPPVAIRPFLWCAKWNRGGNMDANRYNAPNDENCNQAR
jgi:hypothetical protein